MLIVLLLAETNDRTRRFADLLCVNPLDGGRAESALLPAGPLFFDLDAHGFGG